MANRIPLVVDASNSQIKELPAVDNLDLGNSDLLNAGNVRVSNGLVTSPSLSFTNSSNMGFYREGSNQIGISINGVKVGNINALGLNITGNIFGVTYYGDGSNLSGVSAGGGGGNFNTGVSDITAANVTTVSTTFYTAPSTVGFRYIVNSIHVTNVSSNTANISGEFTGTTYPTGISIAQAIPLPVGTSVELLKNPKVLNPSDTIKLNASANNAVQAAITIEKVATTGLYGSGIDITTTNTLTTLHTATANSMIESIMLVNDNASQFDVKVNVAWTNASDTVQSYFAYNLIVPGSASVEVLDAPKFLPNGHKIRVSANQPDRVEAIIAGKVTGT